MKKHYTRLLALALCVIMVFAMVPAKANAAKLDGKKMPQMKNITQNNWGDYIFTTFSDLLELCARVDQTGESVYCVYDSGEPITISNNLTIPQGMVVVMDSAAVTIPAGVTVAVEGYVVTGQLNVYGTVNVAEYGDIGAISDINVYGQANVLGCLSLYDGERGTINGMDKVNFGEYGYVYVGVELSGAADLVEYCKVAESANEYWRYSLYMNEAGGLSAPLTIPYNVNVFFYEPFEFAGDLLLNGGIAAANSVYLNGQVTNLGYISIWFDEGGRVTIGQPEAYVDASAYQGGYISAYGATLNHLGEALYGLGEDDFEDVYYDGSDDVKFWTLGRYKGNPSFHEHTPVVLPEVPANCLMNGMSAWVMCEECGEVLVPAEELAPLGHDYGLDDNGNIDFYDEDCDTCGALRVVDPNRLTHSMYRLYNPNTGEHFYTGSMVERQDLEVAGWKFEGVGFTFPANTGAPVYRLFQPSTGEHLYTMDEGEVAVLMAQGWTNEGVAFNSATSSEVPQYRLWNPNASVGAYHFTASETERNNLLAAGWQDQGIGFYTCLQ